MRMSSNGNTKFFLKPADRPQAHFPLSSLGRYK